MSKLGPQTLLTGKSMTGGRPRMDQWLDAHAAAWEADKARIEELESIRDAAELLLLAWNELGVPLQDACEEGLRFKFEQYRLAALAASGKK